MSTHACLTVLHHTGRIHTCSCLEVGEQVSGGIAEAVANASFGRWTDHAVRYVQGPVEQVVPPAGHQLHDQSVRRGGHEVDADLREEVVRDRDVRVLGQRGDFAEAGWTPTVLEIRHQHADCSSVDQGRRAGNAEHGLAGRDGRRDRPGDLDESHYVARVEWLFD